MDKRTECSEGSNCSEYCRALCHQYPAFTPLSDPTSRVRSARQGDCFFRILKYDSLSSINTLGMLPRRHRKCVHQELRARHDNTL